jgi:hypothetical protein
MITRRKINTKSTVFYFLSSLLNTNYVHLNGMEPDLESLLRNKMSRLFRSLCIHIRNQELTSRRNLCACVEISTEYFCSQLSHQRTTGFVIPGLVHDSLPKILRRIKSKIYTFFEDGPYVTTHKIPVIHTRTCCVRLKRV